MEPPDQPWCQGTYVVGWVGGGIGGWRYILVGEWVGVCACVRVGKQLCSVQPYL